MKENTFVIATVLAATMLMTVVAVIPAEASQASSSTNDCGNGDTPVDVLCQLTTTQTIGADNDVEVDGDQD
jgi:hypothetical protein